MGGTPIRSLDWLFTRLLDKGVWIAGVDVGESWGNAERAESLHPVLQTRAESIRSVAASLPCGAESRGNKWFTTGPVEHPRELGCIVGIYPVTNLAGWPNLGGRPNPEGLRDERSGDAKAPGQEQPH